MLKLIYFLLFSFIYATSVYADPAPKPMPFVSITEWHIATSQVRIYGPDTYADPQPWNAIYFRGNVSDPYPSPQLQQGVWHEVDLTPFGVASDAKMAFVSGMLIITHGTTSETAEIRITMARANDNTALCSKYLGQTVEAAIGGGQRSNMASFIPLYQGKFKFCIYHNNSPNYPSGSSYGINLTLQAWGR